MADPFLAIARRSAADDHVGLGLGLRLEVQRSSLEAKNQKVKTRFACDKMTARILKELSEKI